MLFNTEEVKKFIPHRDPFLFIDSVQSIDMKGWEFGKGTLDAKDAIGGLVTAHFYADPKMDIFNGHFPGKPVLPGVIQLEMMAQASSFVMAFFIEDPFNESTLDVALTTINDAKFRKPVLPGMKLEIKSKITRYRRPMIVTECELLCDNQLMSHAKVVASVRY
jgi:3-hydroxyacyl-[acyl-carrier-protein] dehydratase